MWFSQAHYDFLFAILKIFIIKHVPQTIRCHTVRTTPNRPTISIVLQGLLSLYFPILGRVLNLIPLSGTNSCSTHSMPVSALQFLASLLALCPGHGRVHLIYRNAIDPRNQSGISELKCTGVTWFYTSLKTY